VEKQSGFSNPGVVTASLTDQAHSQKSPSPLQQSELPFGVGQSGARRWATLCGMNGCPGICPPLAWALSLLGKEK